MLHDLQIAEERAGHRGAQNDRDHDEKDVAGICISIFLRSLPVVHQWQAVYPDLTYRLTPFRLDGLLLGSLVAILLRKGWQRRTLVRASALTMLCGLFAMGSMLYKTGKDPGYASTAVFFAGLIVLAMNSTPVGACSRIRSLRALGKYSYCIYIIHGMAIATSWEIAGYLGFFNHSATRSRVVSLLIDLGIPIFALAASYLIAAGSWRLIEAPAMRYKKHFRYSLSAQPERSAV